MFYNEQPEHPGFSARGAAFCAAAQTLGMECTAWVAEKSCGDAVWGFGRSDATEALTQRLVADKSRPTAVFVPTDEQALRLHPALLRRGIQPGRDLFVLSCDNQEVWLRQMAPRPLSIDLNFDLLGSRAVEQLLTRIAHPEQPPGSRILIPPRLPEPPAT